MIRRSIIIISFVMSFALGAGVILKEPPSSASRTTTSTPHKIHIVAQVAPTITTSTVTVPPTTTPPAPVSEVVVPTNGIVFNVPAPVTTSPELLAAWTRVATCENGGWNPPLGPVYPNSLGINSTNWAQFGGTSDLSVDAQIAVAERFRAYYHIGIPDQNGCAAW